QAAALSVQLEHAEQVNDRRRALWYRYQQELASFCPAHGISLPSVPEGCEHNGHILYVRMPSGVLRDKVLSHMQASGVQAQSHYQPLHAAPAASRYARTSVDCANTARIAETIIRLPIYYALSDDEQQRVIDSFKVAVRACMATDGPKAAEG